MSVQGLDNVTMAVNKAATLYASGCKDKVVRKALEMAFIAGATQMVDLIGDAMKRRPAQATTMKGKT